MTAEVIQTATPEGPVDGTTSPEASNPVVQAEPSPFNQTPSPVLDPTLIKATADLYAAAAAASIQPQPEPEKEVGILHLSHARSLPEIGEDESAEPFTSDNTSHIQTFMSEITRRVMRVVYWKDGLAQQPVKQED